MPLQLAIPNNSIMIPIIWRITQPPQTVHDPFGTSWTRERTLPLLCPKLPMRFIMNLSADASFNNCNFAQMCTNRENDKHNYFSQGSRFPCIPKHASSILKQVNAKTSRWLHFQSLPERSTILSFYTSSISVEHCVWPNSLDWNLPWCLLRAAHLYTLS